MQPSSTLYHKLAADLLFPKMVSWFWIFPFDSMSLSVVLLLYLQGRQFCMWHRFRVSSFCLNFMECGLCFSQYLQYVVGSHNVSVQSYMHNFTTSRAEFWERNHSACLSYCEGCPRTERWSILPYFLAFVLNIVPSLESY